MVSLHQALNLILSHCVATDNALLTSSNLGATITHWLQTPEASPIGGSARLGAEWRKLLAVWQSNCGYERIRGKKAEGNGKKPGFEIDFGVPFPPPANPSFTFIDLFAGIGGFRLALQKLGGKCVFSSEWDRAAKQTYFRNFGEIPFGDIHEFTAAELSDAQIRKLIPKHNILAGGFPCQPFSRAGVSARTSLGQQHGFSCEIQGTLFFDIVRIAKALQPDVLLLENVQNLKRHNKGETFRIIRETIENDLKYSFAEDVIDASSLVPQRRKRCFMVCFKKQNTKFHFPLTMGPPLTLRSILDPFPPEKYTISDRLWEGHKKRTQRNLDRGAGFTAFEADLDAPSHTLVARYGKDGKECLIPQEGKNPRKLTPRECARLMGFPEGFRLADADTPAYKQFGNSVVVPVVERVAEEIVRLLSGK